LKRLDRYIIGKFLGTFFFSIVLIMSIAVIFDLTEKLDDFIENQVAIREIIFDYYLNFIPYFMNMFSPLFIFISVIFFTSKLAGDSEIIAILASGVSYHRLMWPYFLSALFLFIFSFWMTGYVIPPASEKMLTFQDKYIQHFSRENARNVQMEVEPGTILYIESFQKRTNMGYRASLEHFDGKKLTMRITADRIHYDSAYNWRFDKYVRRDFDGMRETLEELKSRGYLLAVLSNKKNKFVQPIISTAFGEGYFDFVCGWDEVRPKKPDPTSLLDMLAELGIEKENAWMIGDLPADYSVSVNAGINHVIADWGYGKKKKFIALGATVFAQKPIDLLEIFN
jgi:lipopolysaccharide export LptBFGC system permease protein LptF